MGDLNVAVADDDAIIGETIRQWIETEDPQAHVQVYHSGEELLLAKRPVDIVYLDIRMGGADGIETARRLRRQQKDALLIFVSALKDQVFEAMDVHPFHFLLKPLDRKQFIRVYKEAGEMARDRVRNGGGQFLVKSRKENILIPYDEIIYIESRSRKLEVHTTTGVHEMYGALGNAETELGNGFYRCHRAFLVNLAWISSYHSDTIVLRNGEEIFLAKKKHAAFVKTYMWYLQKTHGIS